MPPARLGASGIPGFPAFFTCRHRPPARRPLPAGRRPLAAIPSSTSPARPSMISSRASRSQVSAIQRRFRRRNWRPRRIRANRTLIRPGFSRTAAISLRCKQCPNLPHWVSWELVFLVWRWPVGVKCGNWHLPDTDSETLLERRMELSVRLFHCSLSLRPPHRGFVGFHRFGEVQI